MCIGETILRQCAEASQCVYVPLYLQQAQENKVSDALYEVYYYPLYVYFIVESIDATKISTPLLLHCTGKTAVLSVYTIKFAFISIFNW